MPSNVKILHEGKPLAQNLPPVHFKKGNYELFICKDQVHLKPLCYLLMTLLIDSDDDQRPLYLKSPKHFAHFEVMLDCLLETINKEEGYEANLADISYDCKNFEDRGLSISFSGYNSTLSTFAQKFIQRMKQLASGHFDQ